MHKHTHHVSQSFHFSWMQRKEQCHSWRNISFAFWFSSMTHILKETSNRPIFMKVYNRLCLFVASLGLIFYFFPFPDGVFWSMEEKEKSTYNCSASYIHFCRIKWLKVANKSILRNGNMRFSSHPEMRSSKRTLNAEPCLDVMMMQLKEDRPKQTSIYFIPC